MTRDTNRPPRQRLVAAAAVVTGLVLNKWSVERLLAPDERIISTNYIVAIVVGQLFWLALGFGLARRATPRPLRVIVLAVATPLILSGSYGTLWALGAIDPHRERRLALAEIQAQEELLSTLAPAARRLSQSLFNLALPDARSRRDFASSTQVGEFRAIGVARALRTPLGLERAKLASVPGPRTEVAREELVLWRPLLDRFHYLTNARVTLDEGRFLDPGRRSFETLARFELAGVTTRGTWRSHRLHASLRWRASGARSAPGVGWEIVEWISESGDTIDSPRRWFSDVTNVVLADRSRWRAQGSLHESLVRQHLAQLAAAERAGDAKPAQPDFWLRSQSLHPALSVVDIDRDGLEDLYVMERHGPNMLLRNRGDGRFEDVAGAYGLDLDGGTTAAIFADFDNDGDADAFLGRGDAESILLINEAGRFSDRSSDVSGRMPRMVTSLSAVDYDRDGLLDLYAATNTGRFPRDAFSSAEWKQLWALWRSRDYHYILNAPGPPNVLLRNLGGGRFERVAASGLEVYRQTYQAAWSDYDRDGDADVYVANDYGSNQLLRNDGGRFIEITSAAGAEDAGFGMGAAWGDYDNDGRPDLYVSNMESHAGQRIAVMDAVDARFQANAGGNALFRQTPGGFVKVSGSRPPALAVADAGWAWGGQFADLDNDGRARFRAPG